VNAPLNSDGEYVHLGAPPVSLLVAVSKDCQYPEAIIKTCNVLYDGIRGFNQEWADIINPVVMDAGVDWESMNPLGNINFDYYDVLPKLGLKVKKFIETGVFDEDATTTDYDRTTGIDAKRFAESKDPTDQAGWIAYYVRAVASSILNAPENVEVLPAFSYSTESMPELIPALRTLEDAAIMQIIIGEKPIDYFDEFVAQWKAAGGDKLTQEVQKAIS
jgi:putative aldouronate transport system substrate-binding protein